MSDDRATAGTPASLTGRVIAGGAGARPWHVPAVTEPGQAGGPLTAARLEQIEQEARAAGHAAGYAEGLAAGQAETGRRVAALDELLAGLAAPLAQLDAAVEKELVELVVAIARRLIRRELKTSPGEIVAVVREGINALPIGERQVRIHLHPDDALLVGEAFGQGEQDSSCRIIEDPALSRGGALISTDVSTIDATLESRVNRVFDQLLGADRHEPEGETP